VACFSGEFIIFECYWAQETPKTRSTALSAAQFHHMGLYAHTCTSKCAAGSPTTTAVAAHEHLGTELALLAGCGAHKTQKTRRRALSAGQSHHMGLYAHICTSKCDAGSPTTASAAVRGHHRHAQQRGHVAAALTRRKPTKLKASEPHLVSGRVRPRARWCLPPHIISLQPCAARWLAGETQAPSPGVWWRIPPGAFVAAAQCAAASVVLALISPSPGNIQSRLMDLKSPS